MFQRRIETTHKMYFNSNPRSFVFCTFSSVPVYFNLYYAVLFLLDLMLLCFFLNFILFFSLLKGSG